MEFGLIRTEVRESISWSDVFWGFICIACILAVWLTSPVEAIEYHNVQGGGNIQEFEVKEDLGVIESVEMMCRDGDVRCWNNYIDGIASGSTASWLKRVGKCESRFRMVWNESGYSYYGIYQFGKSTWKENCNGDINNAYDQVRCAKEMYESGMASRWSCK